jgi:hypothetical protein
VTTLGKTQSFKNFITDTLIAKIQKRYNKLSLTIKNDQDSNVLSLLTEANKTALLRTHNIRSVNFLTQSLTPIVNQENISFTTVDSPSIISLSNLISACFISEIVNKTVKKDIKGTNKKDTHYIISFTSLAKLTFLLGTGYVQYSTVLKAIENNLIRYGTCTIDYTKIPEICMPQ